MGCQPFTEAAAKLLEGKTWEGSDSSAESRPGIGSESGFSNSGTGDSTNPDRATYFGATQSPTKTSNISALNPPTTTQGKQQRANSSTLYQSNQTQPSNINGLYQSTQAQQPANINSGYQPTQGRGQPPSVSALNSLNHQVQQSQLSQPSAPPPNHSSSHRSGVTSQRVKRNSVRTGRHLSQQGVRKMSSGEAPPTITMALINPQSSSVSSDTKQSSTQQLSISVCAALYSYKPCRSEELELRKGEMVGVYGKFKEGWLRGLSLRTGKVGILPGNYVTPVLRTSARLLESKAVTAGPGTVPGRRTSSSSSKTPAVVLALHRVNSDETTYSTGQRVPLQSASMATQPVTSSGGATRKSRHGVGSEGWDTVRRVFHSSHRGSSQRGNHYPHTTISSSSALQSQTHSQSSSQRCNHYPHTTSATSGLQPHSQSHSHSQNFSHIQAPGYSPALLRKKQHMSILPNHNRSLAWMSECPAPSSGGFMKDRDTAARETFDRQVLETRQAASNGQQSINSILVRPDALKNNTEKPTKSVRFLTQPDSPPPRPRTTSLPSGSQPPASTRPGPPPLEVWAPSLTLGRDGPGIILKEGKAPVLRKGLETNPSDVLTSNQKPTSSVSSSPSRHRVAASYQAQTESEMSLMQGEPVLLHRHRPDGRVLLTQESSGHTGLFHSSVLQFLDRFS
ncbi:E3 ubiquitin-protein ligase SH3RF3 isoform X2 [Oncorhynchus mykiss]|uniref:SH3 domain containing ring finger 2 n=1 Tax=Oncorhynchus mykiss TaxID=8022 RepID=A0A8C7UGT2_ONCMY|nr:E3 ubiquitin-protein ligase SH3RF3 isoform X2 [Oncorhynchus mykiss]